MTLDRLITDATIVNADRTTRAHVGITAGKIIALHASDTGDLPPARRRIDATGMLRIPGGVDAHCHVEQVTGPHKSLDTFAIATTAALHCGTTTIISFGIPAGPWESPLQALESKLRLIDGARRDVALYGSLVAWDQTVPAKLEAMAELGVRSVKLYTTNRGTTMADEDTILKVMEEVVRLDGLTYIHCEHDTFIVDRAATCAEAGHVGSSDLPRTGPSISEDASVREILAIADVVILAGAPRRGLAGEIGEHISVPIVDGILAGVKQAEGLFALDCGQHRRGSYAPPRRRPAREVQGIHQRAWRPWPRASGMTSKVATRAPSKRHGERHTCSAPERTPQHHGL